MTFVSMGRWRSKWPAQHPPQVQTVPNPIFPFLPSFLSIASPICSYSPLLPPFSSQSRLSRPSSAAAVCFAGHLPRRLPIGAKVVKCQTKNETCLLLPSSHSLSEAGEGNERRRRREYRTPPLCAYIAYDFETPMLDSRWMRQMQK